MGRSLPSRGQLPSLGGVCRREGVRPAPGILQVLGRTGCHCRGAHRPRAGIQRLLITLPSPLEAPGSPGALCSHITVTRWGPGGLRTVGVTSQARKN